MMCLRKKINVFKTVYWIASYKKQLHKLMHWHLLIRHLEYAYMDHYRWPHAILTETFLRRWHFWHEWSFFFFPPLTDNNKEMTRTVWVAYRNQQKRLAFLKNNFLHCMHTVLRLIKTGNFCILLNDINLS